MQKELLYNNLRGFVKLKSLMAVFTSALSVLIAPSFFHYFNLGGQQFLPIYFIIIVTIILTNWQAGLMTAIISPVISFLLTGMPGIPILFFVLFKAVVLVVCYIFIEKYITKNVFLLGALLILSYQLFGFSFVYLWIRNTKIASMDIMMGYPGLIAQYLLILLVYKNNEKENLARIN